MEGDEIIKAFAKLELERERKESIGKLEEMDEGQLLEVITQSVQKLVEAEIELERLEAQAEIVYQRFDGIKDFIDNCIDPVCQDKWGCSVYDLEIQLNTEEENEE